MNALAGKQIVVTRAPHQAEKLAALLSERGALPLLYPCIDITPPEDTQPFDYALRAVSLGVFDWLILTSANTVEALAGRLTALGLPPEHLARLSIAAIGPATAEAAAALGLSVQIIPDEHTAERLAEVIHPVPRARILLPASAIAAPVLARALEATGAVVTCVTAYRTIMGTGGVTLAPLLDAHQVDAVTFTSESTARYFVKRIEAENSSVTAVDGVCIACLGPKTAKFARWCGLTVSVTASEPTLPALVAALEEYFLSQQPRS